jgi:hypothetical protein
MSQYVRVYYSVVDDERFTGVYDTPHLATWLRLLLLADAMWPASAYVPATERKASLKDRSYKVNRRRNAMPVTGKSVFVLQSIIAAQAEEARRNLEAQRATDAKRAKKKR